MVKVIPLHKEKRLRDVKRKRVLVQIGKTRLHITRDEAIALRNSLNLVLPNDERASFFDSFCKANRFFKV